MSTSTDVAWWMERLTHVVRLTVGHGKIDTWTVGASRQFLGVHMTTQEARAADAVVYAWCVHAPASGHTRHMPTRQLPRMHPCTILGGKVYTYERRVVCDDWRITLRRVDGPHLVIPQLHCDQPAAEAILHQVRRAYVAHRLVPLRAHQQHVADVITGLERRLLDSEATIRRHYQTALPALAPMHDADMYAVYMTVTAAMPSLTDWRII